MLVFSCQIKTSTLWLLSVPPSYTTSVSVSFSTVMDRHLIHYPSLQVYISVQSDLVLFLTVGPSTTCKRYSRWSKSPLTSLLENVTSTDMLVCNQHLLPSTSLILSANCSSPNLTFLLFLTFLRKNLGFVKCFFQIRHLTICPQKNSVLGRDF